MTEMSQQKEKPECHYAKINTWVVTYARFATNAFCPLRASAPWRDTAMIHVEVRTKPKFYAAVFSIVWREKKLAASVVTSLLT